VAPLSATSRLQKEEKGDCQSAISHPEKLPACLAKSARLVKKTPTEK